MARLVYWPLAIIPPSWPDVSKSWRAIRGGPTPWVWPDANGLWTITPSMPAPGIFCGSTNRPWPGPWARHPSPSPWRPLPADRPMKLSICIPNYNYERYLGRTIQSILDQADPDLEILVSDNASTDGSAELVRRFNDPRIRLHVNACNVGFSGNLDRAARL